MDLAMLDIGCLGYSYSAIAASAIYHLTDKDIAVSLSGRCHRDENLPLKKFMVNNNFFPYQYLLEMVGHLLINNQYV